MFDLVEDGIYIDDMDYISQLSAIHELISQHRAAAEKLSGEIDDAAIKCKPKMNGFRSCTTASIRRQRIAFLLLQ